ncbi:MAG TPA: FAD-dependent monooxygenase, partial [Pseudomonadales bacterium]|nr:FAD-dependent monooxygenase [Pseudomonadales bacterium]
EGSLLIGADGIHSAIRAQMHPGQPPIHWGGAIMWRGTSRGAPFRTGASFIGLGTHRQRVVVYPISPPDPQTGLATLNWIAEITVDNSEGWTKGDWTTNVEPDAFIHHFADWDYGWLNVPELISSASSTINEYPMIDRDPIPTWQDERVALLGDAAHPMYPTGSNGATQAIVDARVLGGALLNHGVTSAALKAYDDKLCEEISGVVLRNRGAGPFAILNLVDEKCGGIFDAINDVVSAKELDDVMSGYKRAAGYAMEAINAAPPIIPKGSSVPA